jgi:small-conductance mechanosensitive channel
VDAYSSLIVPALPVTSLTRNIVSAVISVLGLLVILNGLGLSITPMLTALGVGGLAVALALQEPLGNFFAGLFLTLAGQIRVGDYVKLDSGEEGYVVDFSWRSTRLRMLANNLIVVPNAKLAQAIMVNHHLPSEECAVLVQVGVDYASDLGHVERVAIDVGREVMSSVPGGVAEFEPFVRFHTFGESSVDFTMILRARQFVDQYLVKHEFIKRLSPSTGEPRPEERKGPRAKPAEAKAGPGQARIGSGASRHPGSMALVLPAADPPGLESVGPYTLSRNGGARVAR